jgi:hypothetical protein
MINNDLIRMGTSEMKVNVIHSFLFVLLKNGRESIDFFITCVTTLDVSEGGGENKDNSEKK